MIVPASINVNAVQAERIRGAKPTAPPRSLYADNRKQYGAKQQGVGPRYQPVK